MSYTATQQGSNYVVSQDGQRVATTSADGLTGYGLSATNLGASSQSSATPSPVSNTPQQTPISTPVASLPSQTAAPSPFGSNVPALPGTPAVTAIPNPLTPPTNTSGTPTLPQATAPTTIDQFNASIGATLDAQKQQVQASYDTAIKNNQAAQDALTQRQSEVQQLQDNAMLSEGSTIGQETADKQAALDLEKQQVADNYQANQSLINEMDSLMTTGNNIIEQMKATTGLASIMNPRVSQTMTDVAARVGVIQAVISARNNQIGVAQSQLNTSLNAITSIANDQISYYKTVIDFYAQQKSDNAATLAGLSKEQQTYVNAKISSLQDSVTQAQNTATIISKAMLDPNTALTYAKAGITLSDSPAQINQKLAVQGYAQELSDTANKMASSGYSATPIAGVVPVQTRDSQGVTKNWYKDTVSQKSGGTIDAGGVSPSGGGGSSTAFPKGTMASKQYVELSVQRAGLTYAQALAKVPAGQVGVIDNTSGQIGSIPPTEYNTKKYTYL
jgi:hypothetical protein